MNKSPYGKAKGLAKTYLCFVAIAFSIGALPAALTLKIDPYQVFGKSDRPSKISDLAEKCILLVLLPASPKCQRCC